MWGLRVNPQSYYLIVHFAYNGSDVYRGHRILVFPLSKISTPATCSSLAITARQVKSAQSHIEMPLAALGAAICLSEIPCLNQTKLGDWSLLVEEEMASPCISFRRGSVPGTRYAAIPGTIIHTTSLVIRERTFSL